MISPARITAKPFPPCYGLPENEAVGAGDFTGVRYLASSAFVPTNARNRHPALPPDVCFSACWGSTPNPLNSPVAGAGCAFVSRTLLFLLRRNRRLWRSGARRNSVPISTDDLGGAGLQGCRPAPLFLFSRKRRDCRFRLHKGRKPRLSLRSRDNSVREPNAQPAPATGLFKGFGTLSQQAETAVSGIAGNRSFESLWVQRHCLPSSEVYIGATREAKIHFNSVDPNL